jgi:hypothetical protein
VISAPLATLLAIDCGLTAVLGIALALYAGVLMLFPMTRSADEAKGRVRALISGRRLAPRQDPP